MASADTLNPPANPPVKSPGARRPSPGRMAGFVRALAGLGVLVGLLLATGALLSGAQPYWGVPAWAWLALGFACLLVREAGPGPRGGRGREG